MPRDPHRFVNELNPAAVQNLIARLEGRGKDKVFTRLLEKYLGQLSLPLPARILEVGCGTGVVLRSIARLGAFDGEGTGVDHCPNFIAAANRLAFEENVSSRMTFQVGDVHQLDFPSATFDVAIAHTLISHVTDPSKVLREMARVVRPGGTVVIFDGDYGSLTYAFPNREFGRQMDVALANASFNNPLVMRGMPKLLQDSELRITSAWADAVAEIGVGSYFKSFAETYAPFVVKAGLFQEAAVEDWLKVQRQWMDDGMFFASCNYYTFITQRDFPV